MFLLISNNHYLSPYKQMCDNMQLLLDLNNVNFNQQTVNLPDASPECLSWCLIQAHYRQTQRKQKWLFHHHTDLKIKLRIINSHKFFFFFFSILVNYTHNYDIFVHYLEKVTTYTKIKYSLSKVQSYQYTMNINNPKVLLTMTMNIQHFGNHTMQCHPR